MNKLMNFGKLGALALSLALVATSCKKDTGEFPTQTSAGGSTANFVYDAPTLPPINDADGILAAVDMHNYHIITISPYQKHFQYGLAAFTNTTGNFSSLTSGGTVTVDTSILTPSSAMLYQSYPTTYSLNFGSNVSWNVTGAGSVPPMTYTLTNPNPTYSLFPNQSSTSPTQYYTSYWKDEWVPVYPKPLVKPLPVITAPDTSNPQYDSLNVVYIKYKSDSLKFKVDSLWNETPYTSIPIQDYIANADTVFITWYDNTGFKFIRKAPATDSITSFKPNDFLGYPNYSTASDFKMEINCVSYNSVLAGGKKYYYIRMSSWVKYWRTK